MAAADMLTTDELVAKLQLLPHPEGGFFKETFRDDSVHLSKDQLPDGYTVDRPVSTIIYFLLPSGSVSRLHRMPSAEGWHFYMGEPLTVVTIDESGKLTKHALGTPTRSNLNVSLQAVVAPGVHFGAYPTLDYETIDADGKEVKTTRDPQTHYSLVGCTVAPAFDFADFELAQRDPLLQKYPQHSDIIERLTVREA
eukprot:TRINITY_DN18880_c0_g1_i1.p1 TRINITY_DN18880_c0_g1~~TRINITY_DN18880_c0_g1_i1.p1  ORF type:complete len:196 (-),score=41.54 TRINITY_DN18880_c0_g1_i1:180-767(-)